MKNTFENSVIKTDEDYELWRDSLTCWYVLRVVSLILIGILISIDIFWYKFYPFIHSNHWVGPFLENLLDLGFFLLMFMLGSITYMFLCFQAQGKKEIDEIFDPDGVPWHLKGIITSKGIRLAQREIRCYRRQKRLQENEHEEK